MTDVSVAGGTADQLNAFNRLKQFLADNGLPDSLAAWAWEQIITGHGPDTISLELTQRPEFKQAFPEIEARQRAGLPPVSPAEVLAYRQQATDIMRQAGLPQQFYDQPQDFTNLISNDVSVNELTSRVRDGLLAAQQAPQETRDQLQRFYGIDQGGLAAYYLDPNRALPILQNQFQAASLAGTAQRSGYGQLSQGQAEGLVPLGVTQNQAEQGFGQLTREQELFNALPGENTDQITQQEQLGAQFGGNELAAQRIRRRAEQRAAEFGGGGRITTTNTGVTGLQPST